MKPSDAGANGKDTLSAWHKKLIDTLEEDLGGELAATESAAPGSQAEILVEVLAFRLGMETFGFDIRSVNEILRPRPITMIPRSPGFILGILSLRGVMVPVMDTFERLGLGVFDPSSNHRVIIVKDGEDQMGFTVDSVVGVIRFSESDLEDKQYAVSVDPAYLMGIGYDAKKQLIALLNTEKLCDFTLDAP